MPKQQQKEALLEEITGLVQKNFEPKHKDNIDQFINQFYQHPSYEEIQKLPTERIATGLSEMWEYIQERKVGEPKIKVYYWRPDFKTHLSERIVINIVNDDMSFLVDSLIEMLGRFELIARRIIHPVLKLRRDEKGHLEQIFNHKNREAVGTFESVIHCEIVEGATPDLVKELERELAIALRDVRLATSDWQGMREKIDIAIKDLYTPASPRHKERQEESEKFLQWMQEDHFTFLGYCYYDLFRPKNPKALKAIAHEALGIMKVKEMQALPYLFQGVKLDEKTLDYIFDPRTLLVNKATQVSRIHRSVPLDVIGVKRLDAKGNVIGLHLFSGLFTSIAYDSSARDIPLLRRKVDLVLKHAHLSPQWHDGKGLIHILDSLPRDDLFQASVSELCHIGLSILRLQERHRVALFIRRDQFNRFLSCLVYVPRDRFDSELCDQIGTILEEELNGHITTYKAQYGSLAFARVNYTIVANNGPQENLNLKKIEAKLIEISRSWRDDLKSTLTEAFDELKAARFLKKYRNAFGKGYQERFKGVHVLQDIEEAEKTFSVGEMGARLYVGEDAPENVIKLKIYNLNSPIPLSDILPILENLDLRVVTEIPFQVRPADDKNIVWIHDCELESRTGCPIDLKASGEDFLKALISIYRKEVEDDGFNRLTLRAGLHWRQCNLVRAYSKYLRQLQLPFSREYIEQTLVKHPKLTNKLISFFEKKFNPGIAKIDSRLKTEIYQLLDAIESPDEDRILRGYTNLIEATIRTNYFQKTNEKTYKSYISLKFDCCHIQEMPLPKPMYEIFVYSSRVEAVHLRGGKVARGGIRWSDRFEDYRTEILGLMKAQMVKNTVIVPVGSKGGFVTKKLPEGGSREEIMKEGIECYQTMIHGLLDITDNLVKGKIIPPKDVVRWDEDDAYLVVAADKGTATFSDFANKIAQKYNFWLDDAFASGGSAGYDHKKMGITARGAWESAKRHFYELGIDPLRESITVVGVGDMGGDVFGNGMLYSDKIKLVAAFNHMHIFLDPDPDPVKSYAERKRLFELPRSTWADYKDEVLSRGGGIFERKAKIIPLSPEIQQMLGIQKTDITPNDLVVALLKMNVDLLWFGGIGTFVKASHESHSDVGDRMNDAIRINGKDLRVKVIGEGANLGMTQQARIEYARHGGRLNTDAIDNSGGVNCSDHEVNIKILMSQLMARGELEIAARNKLLEKMTEEVAYLVLRDNHKLSLSISQIEAQGAKTLDYQSKFLRSLEAEGKLNRALEFLPDETTLAEYQAVQKGLARPEIAVLQSYAKIYFYEKILPSPLLDDFALEGDLVQYFPEPIRKTYREAILKHPLRREIIATLAVNEIVHALGPEYIYSLLYRVPCTFEDVLKAYLVTRDLLNLKIIRRDLDAIYTTLLPHNFTKINLDLLEMAKKLTHWLLAHYSLSAPITQIANDLKLGFTALTAGLGDILDASSQTSLEELRSTYENLGLPETFSQELATLKFATSSPDIIIITAKTELPIKQVAKLYYLTGERFAFNRLRDRIADIHSSTSWHQMALSGLTEDLYNAQKELVISILEQIESKKKVEVNDHFKRWIQENQPNIQKIDQVLSDIQMSAPIDLSVLTVIVRTMRHFTGEIR